MTTATPPAGRSPFGLDVAGEVRDAENLGSVGTRAGIRFDAYAGRGNLWIVASSGTTQLAALRAGHGSDEISNGVTRADSPDETVFEFSSALGAFRAKISFPVADRPLLRCVTSLLPVHDLAIPFWPRDLYPLMGAAGTVHARQRGLRSGIVFASASDPVPYTLFYFQNFSSLSGYFAATKRSPSGTVGGAWPELGYAPPAGEDCVLPRSVELVVSDVYLTVAAGAPQGDADIAGCYLDHLAETYLALPRPATTYHDWPRRAAQALNDLTHSPACTYVHDGRRFAMPYVGDEEKPPESMVQLTLTVNTREYDSWRGKKSRFAATVLATASDFYESDIEAVVRWLPGSTFKPSQAEENMNHDAMDSWYFYHALFNLARLANDGEKTARRLLERSLPFAMRVARRFDYEWPIFFHLRTLDAVRAESEPGKGGEHDVGGLYALVMLHAHELFGGDEYLAEAKRGVAHLTGLGFCLGYQMNTTGFAAEAALRLWKLTRERVFLELSEICMANMFDNMWLWQCDYGRASHYRTFFGLFPLHDAPYIAAYEELEAQAKFHDYMPLAGEHLRPSLRLLLAEYQKYSLDRAWFYYADTLPKDVLADKQRNGRLERALSVPIEDLHEGFEPSGEVGQEIYGAGLPFVYVSRHYARLPAAGYLVFSEYPMYDFRTLNADDTRMTWRAGGDPRGTYGLRVIPGGADARPLVAEAWMKVGRTRVSVHPTITAEGHALFNLRGGHRVEIHLRSPKKVRA